MELQKWVGSWENFELYFDDRNEQLCATWQAAEEAVAAMPQLAAMFADGAMNFWRKACFTVTDENPTQLGGWEVSAQADALRIEWKAADGSSLDTLEYHLTDTIEKGLEGAPTYIFEAAQASPFACLLLMAPMPSREARLSGGMLSHLHFQFASSQESLVDGIKLKRPYWYATMCDADGSMLERCNVVRGLHRMPLI